MAAAIFFSLQSYLILLLLHVVAVMVVVVIIIVVVIIVCLMRIGCVAQSPAYMEPTGAATNTTAASTINAHHVRVRVWQMTECVDAHVQGIQRCLW